MPGSLSHLTGRFFEVLLAQPLLAEEVAWVDSRLDEAMSEVFFQQQPADQRHAYQAARVVVAMGHDDPATVIAALMHDVGKRHAGLGVWSRSLASLLVKLGVPMGRRMSLYRDHGQSGAAELAALGAPALAVDYAAAHHGPRPGTIEPDTWHALVSADEPQRPGRKRLAR